MTDGTRSNERRHKRLRMVLAAGVILLLGLVAPPLISVNHYKGQITRLVAQAFGLPVRLSSVEVRLLPWPGFALYDLSVAEDPAYGAEPVLHASKVTASLRLPALWRGQLEIDKISVDEASLNVVRAAPGKWNLDPIFHTAATRTGVATSAPGDAGLRGAMRLPSLEATNLRINFKNGVEKLPFSIVSADLSLWQASPGEWRIRLRGQPARTDVSIYQEETGVMRMEAGVRSAPSLSQMPLHLDLTWKEAQLGQLARLITGSDPGWWGDVTGELHVNGTANAAQIAMRLRATGVHRAEFASVTPLDFDANCGFLYHSNRRSIENLVCNSPLGDGRARLTGEKLGRDMPARLMIELDRIPVAAGLDALRTLRSGLDPDLVAGGRVSGKLLYDASRESAGLPVKPQKSRRGAQSAAEPADPLSGSLTVTDFALAGDGLRKPLQAARVVFEPSAASRGAAETLTGTVAIPAGGEMPLVFNLSFSRAGYEVHLRGPAAMARARELAHAAGVPEAQLLASLAGDPLALDVTAAGPWLAPEENLVADAANAEPVSSAKGKTPASASSSAINAHPAADSLTGTVTLRNANWKADYLANHIEISQATLHLDGTTLRWDPVVFSYGPLKGTTALVIPVKCPAAAEPPSCPVEFQMQFGNLDAGVAQTALLGAREKTTLLSSLIDRLHPAASPPWPALEGTVKVDALVLGPVTLHGILAEVRVKPSGAEISSFDAGLFGGNLHLTGSLVKPANDMDKPAYALEGDFQKVDVGPLGALLGLRWTGAALSGNGKIVLAGYTAENLAASAHGKLHFECRRGAVDNSFAKSGKARMVPAALGRFDQWSGDAAIANGGITLGQNFVTAGARRQSVAATVKFGDPPAMTFVPAQQAEKAP